MTEEPTPDQQLIADTINFAQTLLSAGCPIDFILKKSFRYALAKQKRQDEMETGLKGIYDSVFELEWPGYMDTAAQVLVEVVKALGIHPKQIKEEHPYHDHHMVERHP